ncbi:MAG: hypothetical protein QXG57_08465 [Thermofilaceae archaeon]
MVGKVVEKPTQVEPVREGAQSEKAPERTLRSVWKEGRWYVEQLETVRRVLGRDVYTLVRKTYMKFNEGGDWRERRRGRTRYIVLIESYNSEDGVFRVEEREIPRGEYLAAVRRLKKEASIEKGEEGWREWLP